jgi:hypothetical protein
MIMHGVTRTFIILCWFCMIVERFITSVAEDELEKSVKKK